MNIDIDISREIELIIRAKEDEERRENLKNKKEEVDFDKSDVIRAEKGGDKKISSGLLLAASALNNTLKEFDHDLGILDSEMHKSGLDSEFDKIQSEIRNKLSSFLAPR